MRRLTRIIIDVILVCVAAISAWRAESAFDWVQAIALTIPFIYTVIDEITLERMYREWERFNQD